MNLSNAISNGAALVVPSNNDTASLIGMGCPRRVEISPIVFSGFISVGKKRGGVGVCALSNVGVLRGRAYSSVSVGASRLTGKFCILIISSGCDCGLDGITRWTGGGGV